MRTNVKATAATPGFTTHEGAAAAKEPAEKKLIRAVSTCLLFEDTFYESGNALAKRIGELVQLCSLRFVCDLAVKARNDFKLRHVPLWFCVQALSKDGPRKLLAETIAAVIQRADELAEIFAIYRKAGGKGEPRQLKDGVARAFPKFDEYQLAKYDRGDAWKLRDALFLSHPKPKDEAQAALWKKLAERTLKTPDTWEVELSRGADKKATFERLIQEKKLGYLALLRNLRNCVAAGVDTKIIETALLEGAAKSKALPFRFVAAARACPSLAAVISDAMISALAEHAKLPGLTYLLVDVSGSMNSGLSRKSDLNRMSAACALAILAREICESCRVFTFSDRTVEVQAFRGLGMIDGIIKSQPHSGTATGKSLNFLQTLPAPERIVVFTDEQSRDNIPACWAKFGYIMNVATYEPALPIQGSGWTRISGFSERVIDWMMAEEAESPQ